MTDQTFPLTAASSIKHNTHVSELIELAVRNGEGRLASTGAFVAQTGEHTGRSAKDKFVVRDQTTEDALWWENNQAISTAQFDQLYQDFLDYAAKSEPVRAGPVRGCGSDLPPHTRACSAKRHGTLSSSATCCAVRKPSELPAFTPEFTVVNFPGFRADPARHGCHSETIIALNFTKRLVLIGGSLYAGETKKSVFSFS